ncbi:MAG: radical SAM protein, partial [Magnetococcales bacterium]|nr:radical SAM protein [Magnetococcales bacterium]
MNFRPEVNGDAEAGVPMAVLTMGCRVNQYESEVLGQGGAVRGYRLAGEGEPVALVVVNTCSVTGESDRQARQLIRRAAREHPGARIVVTGCYAQRAPAELAELPGVALVLGNGEKARLWELLEEGSDSRVVVGDVARLSGVPEQAPLDHFGERARAFLQVQDGCDRACAYCLIPQVRGPGRSVLRERVVEQARRLIGAGYEELVVTGVDLGAYGRDLTDGSTLAGVTRDLLGLPGLGRLRLSSVDPLDLDEGLLNLFAGEERLCGHAHLSIQSGDDEVRRRMG